MITYNQPFVWFDSLDEEVARDVVDAAKRCALEIRKRFRKREEGIRQLRLERIWEKEAKVKEKEAKALKDRMELITKVDAMGGLWRSEEDMKQGLIKVKADFRRTTFCSINHAPGNFLIEGVEPDKWLIVGDHQRTLDGRRGLCRTPTNLETNVCVYI